MSILYPCVGMLLQGTWAVFINSVLIGTYRTLGPIANALGVYMGNGYGGYRARYF